MFFYGPIFSWTAAKKNEIKQKEIIEIIARNAKRLQRLTEDILDITKIEGKTLKLNKQSFILSEIIREIVQDYTAEISESSKDVSLSCLTSSEEPEFTPIIADQNRIKQVLCNLIDNAIKFTQKGKIIIATEIDSKDSQIIVEVKDTGTGIDSDILSKLFTKFVTKPDSGGTGVEGQEVIVDILKKIREMKSVTLVYAIKDEKYNNAVTLKDYLLKKLNA